MARRDPGTAVAPSLWLVVLAGSRSQVSGTPGGPEDPVTHEVDARDGIARLRRLIQAETARGPSDHAGVAGQLHRLCTVLVRVLPATGAGITLWAPGGMGGGIAAHAGPGTRELEELQFTLGEGPCIEACSTRRVVLEPDLAGRGTRRWPGYGPAASEAGASAVFAFPLGAGSGCVGSLDVYRAAEGSLSPAALRRGFWFAEIALQLVLNGQSHATPGALPPGLDDALAYRLEVYQAQGMITVDLGVSLAEAMLRLRAYAFAVNRPVGEVAHDIVDGRLWLDRDPEGVDNKVRGREEREDPDALDG